MSTPAHPSVTITARQLAGLVDPVLPFASTDDTVPLLTGIRLTRRGRWLIATATDRYKMALKRLDLGEDETGEDWRAVVRVRDLKKIRSLWRPTRHSDPALTLSVEPGDSLVVPPLFAVSSAEAFDAFQDMRAVFATVEFPGSPYPAIDRIMLEALAQPAATPRPVALNPRYVAALAVAQENGEPATSWGGWGDWTGASILKPNPVSKPVAFTVGDDFVAAIVQIRTAAASGATDGRPDVSSWVPLLTAAVDEAAARAK